MANAAASGGRDPRAFLRGLFDTAIAAADPRRQSLARFLPPPPRGRTIVVGGGKSAASMAAALEAAWPKPLEGTVVTRHGHAAPTRSIEVVEASHPVRTPQAKDAAPCSTGSRVWGRRSRPRLISGGGSALLALPAPGLTLVDKQAINRALLACGANISEMNRGAETSVGDQGRAAGRERPRRHAS